MRYTIALEALPIRGVEIQTEVVCYSRRADSTWPYRVILPPNGVRMNDKEMRQLIRRLQDMRRINKTRLLP